ncbi:EAL domain-containing protein [Pleionea sp. CnH1-48]|uniref:EAL domain-containing response regulator n=1 Tax=Pleionea sp. CnH1-48 TaxID=2954494 RepID=UPI0020975AFB|nr:EAL domain-containing protein [Pleionea sp. CnH1-48]MCO7227421.1 EAL domain-containing protein [Pleionea sp. CnH1-48]
MASDITPIHLLMLESSSNDAETLITTLRNRGYAVRATQVIKEDDLQTALEKQSWDLCFCRSSLQSLPASKVADLVNEHGRDIPIILITDKEDEATLINALQIGLKDAVSFESQERVYLVAKRELENLQQRKARKKAESQLRETEKRCNLLLDSSQDAIAYIHDGMHIYANQSYVELFGFEDPDELLCMPVMDMISSDSHEGFKGFLRQYAKKPSNNQFACEGVKADMSEFEVILTLSNASYDNEECTQVLIRTTSDSAELEARVKELSAQDVMTGLYNQNYFQEQLDEIISTSAESGQRSHLLFVAVDQFDEISRSYGIAGTDDLARDLSDWFREQSEDNTMIARFGNSSYMLLVEEESPDSAKSFAENLCVSVRDHLFELEGKTQRLTFSIGICPVGDQSNNAKELISNAHASCLRVKEGDGVKVFNRMIDQGDSKNGEMIEKLHEAIESGKMHLMFQPIVKLHSETRALYQTLLRVQTETGEEVSPNEIFPIAQVAGLAAKLDRWVIMKALKTLKESNSQQKPTIFIYLSGSSLTDDTLMKYIQDVIKAVKLPTSSIVFQVNANDAMTYLKRVITLNNALKKARIGLAITHVANTDDHISLLDQLLPTFVFADGDITLNLGKEPEAVESITKICNEAHQRDIHSIVPMVEDAGSLAALWPVGVHYIQGFYLQGPTNELDYDFEASEF